MSFFDFSSGLDNYEGEKKKKKCSIFHRIDINLYVCIRENNAYIYNKYHVFIIITCIIIYYLTT